MSALPPNIKASYKGSLEMEKVLSVLSEYHFMFMPTRGENFGHIILQSLSVGCPVIISDQTPWKQLEQKDVGWDVSLGEESTFAKVIDLCANMHQSNYNVMSHAAYAFAKKYSDDPEILEQNKHLFIV
jgi:glycosyltransferase involved in cell wall biosynthesis